MLCVTEKSGGWCVWTMTWPMYDLVHASVKVRLFVHIILLLSPLLSVKIEYYGGVREN